MGSAEEPETRAMSVTTRKPVVDGDRGAEFHRHPAREAVADGDGEQPEKRARERAEEHGIHGAAA